VQSPGHEERDAQTRPTLEELRVELKDLGSTATRLIEQALRLTEKYGDLGGLDMSGTFETTEIMTIAHSASTRARACGWCLLESTMASALDRIGRGQLSPNKLVTCL